MGMGLSRIIKNSVVGNNSGSALGDSKMHPTAREGDYGKKVKAACYTQC